MDDPESESKWKIQEYNYSSSKEGEDESTVVRWILSTIGREMMITGITISSAQLALIPPLVVFSAMGLPFGVFYASYACTTKILSLLLPIPPSPSRPPPMLLDNCCPQVEEGYVADHEEDMNELGVASEIVFQLDDCYTQQGQSLNVNADEDVDQMEMEDNILQREINYVTEENERETLMEDVSEAIKTRPGLVEEHKGNDQRLVESADYELEEKFRDEDDHFVSGSAANVVLGDVESVGFGDDVKDVEATKLVTFEEINSHKPVQVGNKRLIHEIHHTLVLSDENNLNPSNAYALDMAATEVVESNAFKDGIEDAILRTMEQHLIHSDVEKQEISDKRSMNNNLENSEDFDGAGDDQGYGEDVGEYLEGDDDGLHEERKAKEPLVEGWNDKNESDAQEVDEHAKLRDQGWFGNTVENDAVVSGSASIVDLGDVRDVETTKPVTAKEIESHKLVEEGIKNEEQLSEMHHTVVLCDENNLNSSELDPVAREVVGDADKGYEEEKGKQPLVESWNNEANEDAKLRDERRVDMVEDDHNASVSGSSSDVVLGDVKDVETTKPVTVKHADTQIPVEVGNKTEEHVCELRHMVVISDENNLSSREVYTLDLAVAAGDVIRDADKDERTIKFDETVVAKSSASTDGSEYTVLRTIEEHMIHSIGEESLLDEEKTNNLECLEVGNYQVKENAVNDKVDSFARSLPSEHDIDNGNKVKENAGDDDVNVLAPSSKRETVDAKVVYKKMMSREENLDVDDDKIWEKIRAMKTIVGYNAPSQSTCIGELKALYVFTGVEPPASFEGDSDLDAKLKFLMAIVGVK